MGKVGNQVVLPGGFRNQHFLFAVHLAFQHRGIIRHLFVFRRKGLGIFFLGKILSQHTSDVLCGFPLGTISGNDHGGYDGQCPYRRQCQAGSQQKLLQLIPLENPHFNAPAVAPIGIAHIREEPVLKPACHLLVQGNIQKSKQAPEQPDGGGANQNRPARSVNFSFQFYTPLPRPF